MKRQGRQHGMVRSYRIIPSPLDHPTSRFVNRFECPPTAGVFTKVSTKPTNHSKFTSKCDRVKCSVCRTHPAHKSKDKAKGALKHNPLVLRDFSGSSVAGILDRLGEEDGHCLNIEEHGNDRCNAVYGYVLESAAAVEMNDKEDEDIGADEDWCFVENNSIVSS